MTTHLIVNLNYLHLMVLLFVTLCDVLIKGFSENIRSFIITLKKRRVLDKDQRLCERVETHLKRLYPCHHFHLTMDFFFIEITRT